MDQAETIRFLSSGRGFASQEPVEKIETHGALIFLCGDTALKLKRAVTYDYMDLSTPERRRAMIARELELNRPFAPQIYRDMLPVTRSNGSLALGGDGPVVDWVLRMWRFRAEDEMDQVAKRGDLDDKLAVRLGMAIADYHAAAPVRRGPGRVLMADILEELRRVFAEFDGAGRTARVGEWQAAAAASLDAQGPLLDARGGGGHIRRAHGDLHLRNLVLIDGRPVLFDALEFDETLGTCDVLYDIAFLIMDLCHRDLRRQGCRVLDAWLRAAHGTEDAGLATLPLFLSVRAAIRAMVLLQTDAARGDRGRSAHGICAYLDLACAALTPPRPALIGVGGFSGSGKSVLARALARHVGPLPGAVLLSSDLERKVDAPLGARLDPKQYRPERRAAVYGALFDRAARIIGAGHAAVMDATFLDPSDRASVAAVAKRAGVSFQGFWLDAPEKILAARLETRSGDASDADTRVLKKQLAAGCGPMDWHRLDARGDAVSVYRAALRLLSAPSGAQTASP